MSSHREAPAISKDPAADNTDLYAFVSPDAPDTVTIIANYVPAEYPPGGPNFYEFGDDVRYEINIDNDGDGRADVTYRFAFSTDVRDPESFLYNTGPIGSLDDPNWNRRQRFTVTRVGGGDARVIGSGLSCPPCNVGPRSTPDYESLASAAVHVLNTGEKVFCGQRADAFAVDLGSIFDLGDLRPFQNLHLIPTAAQPGVNDLDGFNVHTIAIQVPKRALTRNGKTPTDASKAASVIGVWASASRRRATILNADGSNDESGPWVQVSRLGNPLINEVVIPMGDKDRWNARPPAGDDVFLKYYRHPELAKLLPVLYPNVFPNLAGLKAARADLVAILLTGIPSGIIDGFQNFTGPSPADLLRLNMAIPPASSPNELGILGGDVAGFPNGRRVADDVVAIELRAVAGTTYPLIDPSFTADAAASKLDDGVGIGDVSSGPLGVFPYLGTPYDGYGERPPQNA
jgi:Domain of unknown function (DUF4331)